MNGMQQERSLAAIMFTDIVNYTALMEQDEHLALHILELNRQLIKSTVSQHHGQWIKEIGDGTLSTFHSTLDALHCALKILKLIADYPELNLRIALHLGDIVQEDHDIFGDGVNIASRLQHLSPVNGLAISEHFHAQIHGKTTTEFVSIGCPKLKNISTPLEVLIWDPQHNHSPHVIENNKNTAYKNNKSRSNNHKTLLYSALILIIFSLTYWITIHSIPSTSTQQSAHIAKNSIAVLKFRNIGSDDSNYFNEGLSEELLNLLARIKAIKVASRTSTWSLPENIDAEQVRNKLNVNYMVEGSIRKDKNKIRVTVQLINTQTGFHLWSETYDRTLSDIINIQDEIATKITNSLKILLSAQAQQSLSNQKKVNPQAYEYYLKGKFYLRQEKNLTNLRLALQHFKKALSLDDSLLLSFAGLCQSQIEVYRITRAPDDFTTAEKNCNIILKTNHYKTDIYNALGNLYLVSGRYDNAENAFRAALTLDLNSLDALLGLGKTLAKLNKKEQASQFFKRALETAPEDADVYNTYAEYLYLNNQFQAAINNFNKAVYLLPKSERAYNGLGSIYFVQGKLDAAITAYKNSLAIFPTKNAYANLGTIYFMQKNFTNAKEMYEQAIKLSPDDYRFWGFLAETYQQLPSFTKKVTTTYLRAIELAKKSLQLNNKEIDAQALLALYYAKIKNTHQAQQILTSLNTQNLPINILYTISTTYLTLNKPNLALKFLQQAISKGYPKQALANDINFKALYNNTEFKKLTK